MTIGSVACNPTELRVAERTAAQARRADLASQNEPAVAETLSNRQDFVLGAKAYRQVVATLESDRGGALQPDSRASYTGQQAQRSYQTASQSSQRESLSSLFGVDVFI